MIFRNRIGRTVAIAAIAAMVLSSQTKPVDRVGPTADKGFLLASGWKVTPAGTQIKLDTLPMSSLLSPDGKYLIVLNAGYNPPSLNALTLASGSITSSVPVPDAWLGLAMAPNGKTLWVGGGSRGSIYEFSLSEQGGITAGRTFELLPADRRSHRDFIGDVTTSPDGRLLYAADIFHDQILVVNPQSGRVIDTFKTGRRPYKILFHPDGKSFFVTSWADATLFHHQADNGYQLSSIRLGQHPTDIVWRPKKASVEGVEEGDWAGRLFISAANTNSVYVVSVSDSKDLKLAETVNIATTPMHPLGMTPSALALSADQGKLFVVCSDANTVAMVDVAGANSHVLGFIPTGWYPTAARALADGGLAILNGKGARSYPNPGGPNPTAKPAPVHAGGPAIEYVGRIQTGSVSILPPISDEQLQGFTATVLANSPYTDRKLEEPGVSLPSAIDHVIYIVKENRTYDQVLGDIGKGESDSSLVLFPEAVSPNHHKLAREFVLLDNFYVSGDVSADGHNWSTAAIASDYVQKFWPNSYAGRRKHYDYEGGEPAALPAAGYLWTNARAKGITMRNYGYFAAAKTPAPAAGVQVENVRDAILAPVTNPDYRPFDLDYPDGKRADVFIKDLHQAESTGQLARLSILRLGNDHTSGATPGKLTPQALVADNDYALGRIVEAVSKSKFWKNTAIFVLEDDAQNGPDHIDSHRSPAFVLSAYSRRGTVDSTMYNTVSVLRTIELILGMRPMTHFDAAATPMSPVFSSMPSSTPYTAEKPRIALDSRNPAGTQTAARSVRMRFEDADLNDDDDLNDVLWRSIRHSQPPVPTRSFFSK